MPQGCRHTDIATLLQPTLRNKPPQHMLRRTNNMLATSTIETDQGSNLMPGGPKGNMGGLAAYATNNQ